MNDGHLEGKDHDLIIGLVHDVGNNHQDVIGKIEDIKKTMADIKDGVIIQLTDHDQRIKANDERIRRLEALNLIKRMEELGSLQTEVHDFVVSAKTWRVIGGFIGGLVLFVLTQLPNILRLLGITK